MYKCSNCDNLYKDSEMGHSYLPNPHIIKCPHCGDMDCVVGADLDYDPYYGATPEKPVMMMYSRRKEIADKDLPVFTGIKS